LILQSGEIYLNADIKIVSWGKFGVERLVTSGKRRRTWDSKKWTEQSVMRCVKVFPIIESSFELLKQKIIDSSSNTIKRARNLTRYILTWISSDQIWHRTWKSEGYRFW